MTTSSSPYLQVTLLNVVVKDLITDCVLGAQSSIQQFLRKLINNIICRFLKISSVTTYYRTHYNMNRVKKRKVSRVWKMKALQLWVIFFNLDVSKISKCPPNSQKLQYYTAFRTYWFTRSSIWQRNQVLRKKKTHKKKNLNSDKILGRFLSRSMTTTCTCFLFFVFLLWSLKHLFSFS